MDTTVKADWIAVDWGTSNLRAYAMRGGDVRARASSDAGMGKLSPDTFEPVLRRLTEDWGDDLVVVACGMLGSRQGWVEAPYRAVPCTPLGATLVPAPVRSGGAVHVVPGLSQQTPPDVMRGEETQIAGFLSLNPGWDGVICLPGTHTKWVLLSAGEVVSFQTFMTGEIFALLSEQSVLRHSVGSEEWEGAAFETAVGETLSQPERLAARLFGLRAAALLENQDAATGRAALSGYLIGAELAAARPYWLGQSIAILGMGAQAQAYRSGLDTQGAPAMLVDSERATLAGLIQAYRSLKETT